MPLLETTNVFPNTQVFYCGGHFNHAFGKSLDAIRQSKSFSPALQTLYANKYGYKDLHLVKCHCERHNNVQGYGCITKEFITACKSNMMQFMICAETNHHAFAENVTILGM